MTPPFEEPAASPASPMRTLSVTSIGALRLWLQSQRTGAMSGHALNQSDMRRALRLVCAEVQRRGLPVERLIILVKEQWFTLPDDGDGGSLRSRDALEQIIRTCIEEFYATTDNLARAPGQSASDGAT